MALIGLAVAALLAGIMNALAGGGSFLTFPALLLTGLDARAANITSTIALFPGQITTGLAGRRFVSGAGHLSFRVLFAISVVGGGIGAVLLLLTPPAFFARLVPWLVLFATGVFFWGNFLRRPRHPGTIAIRPRTSALLQLGIAIYGGYFGGGIGILMLAALTMAGLVVRVAGATKNVLAGVINSAAVVIFLFSGEVAWRQAGIGAVAAIAGGQLGAWMLQRVNETLLRVAIVLIGLALTIGLLLRAP
ncbi:MAG TPA: sulfite exporter TauE/SafE family protein [Acetobacteraceae bacterium]|nr:sulfite exporter TauE/SafE family protein [Acetobacteraceae bacterium]